jgi:tetratricopeptide (TPR) repeat protein
MLIRFKHIVLLILVFSMFSCEKTKPIQKTTEIDMLCDSAWFYRRIDFEKALQFADKAIIEAEKNNPNLLGKAYYHKGSCYLNNGKSQEAISYYEMAKGKFDDSDTFYLGKALNGIGLAYADLSRFEEAKGYYQQSFNFFKKQNNIENQAVAIQNIGVIEYQQGNIKEALDKYLQVDSIFRQLPNVAKGRIAINLTNLAIVYNVLKEHKKARSIYKQAIENFEAINDLVGMAQVYVNLGVSYFDSDIDSSFYYHSKSLEISESFGHEIGIANGLTYVGDIYREKGDFEKAVSNYNKATELLRTNQFTFGLINTLISLADVYKRTEKYDLAIKSVNEAIDSTVSTGTLDHQQRAYTQLYEIYKKKKDYEKALNTSIIVQSLKDSIVNTEKYEAIKSIEAKFESHKKQNQIDQLTIEKELISLRYTAGIVFVILLLAVVLIVLNRRLIIRKRNLALIEAQKQIAEQNLILAQIELEKSNTNKKLAEIELENERLKNEKTEAELELRKKLLLNYALRISNKNEFLLNIKEKLKDKNIPDTDRLKQVSTLINRNLIAETELKELDTIMESVGAEFFLKLAKYSAEFNETEKKICVFLSLDMSSKDISSILAISPKTIDNYRSSIRKKLGIEADENLTKKLNNL